MMISAQRRQNPVLVSPYEGILQYIFFPMLGSCSCTKDLIDVVQSHSHAQNNASTHYMYNSKLLIAD